eukprot:5303805-Karenia_brevis.AAC.1
MKAIAGNGRVQLTSIILPHDVLLVVANVYGWTNGHTDAQARTRTDSMISMILNEFSQLPEGPRLIVGDFNADVENLPTLDAVVEEGKFVDLGAQAHVFNQPPTQPT